MPLARVTAFLSHINLLCIPSVGFSVGFYAAIMRTVAIVLLIFPVMCTFDDSIL